MRSKLPQAQNAFGKESESGMNPGPWLHEKITQQPLCTSYTICQGKTHRSALALPTTAPDPLLLSQIVATLVEYKIRFCRAEPDPLVRDEVPDGGSNLRVGSGGLDWRAEVHLGVWTEQPRGLDGGGSWPSTN